MVIGTELPDSQAKWFWLILCGALVMGGSALVLGYELQLAIAQHDVILSDIPGEIHILENKIDIMDRNIVRICTALEVNCLH